MIKWRNLFDWKVTAVEHPEPAFVPLAIDPKRRDCIGYKVRVKYKNHETERVFKLKRANKKLQKIGDHAIHEEARNRAWKYHKEKREKMMA